MAAIIRIVFLSRRGFILSIKHVKSMPRFAFINNNNNNNNNPFI